MDIYRYDESFRLEGIRTIAGVDEAGRGPVAGPVVAAAVVLPPGASIRGLRDSKKIPEAKRKAVYHEVLRLASHVGVGLAGVEAIDRFNILEASKMAMLAAVEDLSMTPDLLLIDAVELPSLKIKQHSPIKGDDKSACIAAASVVAKVVRDCLMLRYHCLYPGFGFDRHKGYATRDHLDRLRAMGPCPIHRSSFKTVGNVDLPF